MKCNSRVLKSVEFSTIQQFREYPCHFTLTYIIIYKKIKFVKYLYNSYVICIRNSFALISSFKKNGLFGNL